MVVSAHEVAAELRDRLPGLGAKKQHKLLYYCQGHHLATFGEPLFAETISAWDMGPVVGALWHQEKAGDVPGAVSSMTEAQLNTIGYVVSRYGGLSGSDLQRLTHSELPWQQANAGRTQGTSARIPVDSLREYFASANDDESDETIPLPDAQAVATWLSEVPPKPPTEIHVDSLDDLRARFTRA